MAAQAGDDPVVMAAASDAVEDGFAQSLARPGGNFTGMSLQVAETTGKRLELLRELVPGRAPVGVMWEARGGRRSWQLVENAARARVAGGLPRSSRRGGDRAGVPDCTQCPRGRPVVSPGGGLFDRYATRIARLAIQYRLPAMYALPGYVVDYGGLMSYSPDLVAIWKRAAYFVDRILKGAKPGDLPIEQATEFELLINLTAAKEIGLAVPQAFRLRATRVVDVPTPPPEGTR